MNVIATASLSYPKTEYRINQDKIFAPLLTGRGLLMAVADGVGSYSGASEASSIAIDVISEINVIENYIDCRAIFEEILERIKKKTNEDATLKNAATTLTFCYLMENGCWVGHIGDCRLYAKFGSKLIQLTKDHTQHQMLLDEGVFTKKQLQDKPGKNILTTAISANTEMKHDVFFIPSDELKCDDETITLYIMSDGAHSSWEKRPRFSVRTMSDPIKFTNGLMRRIERQGPTDDYSIVGIMIDLK